MVHGLPQYGTGQNELSRGFRTLPLNKEALTLETGPRSVQDARRWVVEACRLIDRDDLSETAELGISELVTNAILHAAPPVRVRLRGTRDHPRVEVFDGSLNAPAPYPPMTDDDELLSTIGRGLGIVAMCSDAWGAVIQPEGKFVWFEPAIEVSDNDLDLDGDIYDSSAEDRISADAELHDGVNIEFAHLPVNLYVDFRRHYRELRRELRLLALAHETDYPVAKNLSDLFRRFDDEFRMARGADKLDRAIAAGEDQADITLVVPRSSPTTSEQMIDLLELADAFCRAERLLSLATTPQQLQFQRWYLGEFSRQAKGKAPRPWSGSDQVQRLKQSTS
jgi:anti-sigma regulatory factor (Ser/Thr protein kinase)